MCRWLANQSADHSVIEYRFARDFLLCGARYLDLFHHFIFETFKLCFKNANSNISNIALENNLILKI